MLPPHQNGVSAPSIWLIVSAAAVIAATAGCQKTVAVPEQKAPIGIINVEVLVFRLPRSLAASVVLKHPRNADDAAILKQMHELVAEKKAVLVASPAIGTLSGQRAVSESVLEHKYPTEFSQPQIPQTFGATSRKVTKTKVTIETETTTEPETQAMPTAFEKRDVGATLEVDPSFDPDSGKIVLQAAVQFVAHQGNIKYPVATGGVIEQPEFYTKKISFNALVRNGAFTLIGSMEPDKSLSKDEDLTEVAFIRATTQ